MMTDKVYPFRDSFDIAPDHVITVVRLVVPDWDGKNILTVRRCIAKVSRYEQDLTSWTWDDVYQEFALSWMQMKDEMRGNRSTAYSYISSVPPSVVTVGGDLTQGIDSPKETMPLGLHRRDVPGWFSRDGFKELIQIPEVYLKAWEALIQAFPNAVAKTKRDHLKSLGCDTKNALTKLRGLIERFGLTIDDWALKPIEIRGYQK